MDTIRDYEIDGLDLLLHAVDECAWHVIRLCWRNQTTDPDKDPEWLIDVRFTPIDIPGLDNFSDVFGVLSEIETEERKTPTRKRVIDLLDNLGFMSREKRRRP